MQEKLRLLQAFYRQAGYKPWRMSKFENYELYADKKDFLISDRIITFTDTDGSLLALKPDVTLSIVQSVPCPAGETQKLWYQESVYRPAGSEGRFREITQCGLECLGALTPSDLSEVLNLASVSLRTLSADSLLCVSHLGILDALLDGLGADERLRTAVLRLTATRNLHELSALFTEQGWPEPRLNDLRELLGLSCSLGDLPERLRSYPWLPDRLLIELAEVSGVRDAVFDFSITSNMNYYNGLVFQGFVNGISERVLTGGQYDRLMSRMNRRDCAVGFAVYLDGLPEDRRTDPDVVLLCDAETDETRLRETVVRLQSEGKTVAVQTAAELLDLRGGKKPC